MSIDAWRRARRILCVRLDTIGDVLMTTPAIRALREAHTERHITLLTSAPGAAVARLVPEIDEVIAHDAPWLKRGAERRNPEPDRALITRLRGLEFDAAVIFTVYSQSALPAALLCYLAGIPLSLAHCRENPYALLTDWVPEEEPRAGVRHEVRRQLDLVAAIGARAADEHLSLQIPNGTKARVLGRLREQGVDLARPWLILHPGASAPARRYPPERFAEVGRQLYLEHKYQVLITGDEAERPLVAAIQAAMSAPSIGLAGAFDLDELAALISLAPVLIANNTGPVHIAAAVGTPVVDLYALTNPQHTPWMVPSRVLSHDVPCKYCYRSICPEGHHRCLRLISPSEVVAAARDLLAAANLERTMKEVPV
jgi:lipopolysaccharide heptosyltransferase II